MRNTVNFRPAISCPPVVAFARAVLSPTLRLARGVAQVEIAAEDVARLQALQGERVVLTPNHPTNTDPALLFVLSRRAGINFNYLCCREAFDGWGGLWGAFIQRIGAYSVVRGTVDRDSFRYTRELLARPAAKLVIFPEGEVYSQNDSLLPFQLGALQLALWGREEARKTEPDAQVLLLPCALRYRFAGDVRPALQRKLAGLERHLKLAPGPDDPDDVYARMLRVTLTVFEAIEREYNLKPGEDDELAARVTSAKEAALSRAAHLLGVPLQGALAKGTLPERMRALLHTAEQKLHEDFADAHAPAALVSQHLERVRLAWRDLSRLANWIAMYDGYVRQSPVAERIAEVVYRLEMEAFGRASHAGKRIATVRVGEPLPLPEEMNRRDLPALTLQLEKAVETLLNAEPLNAETGTRNAEKS